MGCFACFDGGKHQRKEEDRLASQEARAKAAEAAEKRQEQFYKSAAGRAAHAQLAAAAKQSSNTNKGDLFLSGKWDEGVASELSLVIYCSAYMEGINLT